MKAITALLDVVPGWIWAIVCAGLFAWGGVNQYRVVSAKADLSDLKASHAQALVEAQQAATEQTAQLQEKKDAAIAEAEKRAVENAVAAGRARTELGRLRSASATGAGNAGTSDAACVAYASAATDVLNECGSALVDLAQAADGHVADLRTTRESWPEWDKFAQQMTEFPTQPKGMK
jgi:hypothetical protein